MVTNRQLSGKQDVRLVAKISIVALLVPLLCSCSTVSAGRYVVPSSIEGATEMSNDTWRTHGAAPIGAGASRRDTIEWSLGTMRPAVYERHFSAGLRYIMYPTTVRERCLLFGPPLLPVIPVWFWDPEVASRPHRVRIVWRGNIETAKGVTVYYVAQDSRHKGNRTIVSTSQKEMECHYVFDVELADESQLLLDDSGGAKVVRIPLKYHRGMEWFPYIRMFGSK